MILSAQLDPALNRMPDSVRHVHIMGVCGTGMAALAGLLKEQGFTVTGSDEHVYPPMSDFLAAAGIVVLEGYCAENLSPPPDLVIIGNVIRAVCPEAVRLAELAIPYLSMPQALGAFFLRNHTSLVVAGTHGKTTTSSMLATALYRAGSSPGFMIGGIVEAFGRNFRIGEGEYFVVEGDEYDTAFFNKVSKFLHYQPKYAILTSIEFDHADIFANLGEIEDSFSRFIDLLPKEGALVANMDDPVVAEIANRAICPVIAYGLQDNSLWQPREVRVSGLTSHFIACRDACPHVEIHLPMPGMHNVLNATAVVALMDHLGFSADALKKGLESFEGVKRRQQVRGVEHGVTVIDDFAHHPTAVRETLHALRLGWPDKRLIAVFEPRTNSSRRAVFQQQYAGAFADADMIIVREHVPLDTVPSHEQFSSRQLVDDLRKNGSASQYCPDTEAILHFLAGDVQPGDIVAILSNGDFDNIHERLLAILRDLP